MRLLVVSDTHGVRKDMEDLLALHPEANALIHLGDGMRELRELREQFPELPVYAVRGNCDWPSDCAGVPASREETFRGVKVFMTHGQDYGVKMDLTRFLLAAEERQAQVALFGHTHQPLCEYHDGLYLMNPGSLSRGWEKTYGILDITPAGIAAHTAVLA